MTQTASRVSTRAALIATLCVLCLLSAACEGPSFVAYVVGGPPKTKAVYELEEAATLVIVDDPAGQLKDPHNPVVLAANARHHLVRNEVLPEEMLITQDRLSALAAKLGEDYAKTPIDQLGSELGAQQVIYVLVSEAGIRSDNTYYQPNATLKIKVIDVPTGSRLFPPAPQDGADQSHTLTIEMDRQTVDETRRHALPQLTRQLAERAGLQTAQLFYKHIHPDAK